MYILRGNLDVDGKYLKKGQEYKGDKVKEYLLKGLIMKKGSELDLYLSENRKPNMASHQKRQKYLNELSNLSAENPPEKKKGGLLSKLEGPKSK